MDVKLVIFAPRSKRRCGRPFGIQLAFLHFPEHFFLTLINCDALLLLLLQSHPLRFLVICLFAGSSTASFRSSSSNSRLTFSLSVTAIRNCSSQILICRGGSGIAVVQNTAIPKCVRLSWVRNPAGCAI